jgi:hypothetical protein
MYGRTASLQHAGNTSTNRRRAVIAHKKKATLVSP